MTVAVRRFLRVVLILGAVTAVLLPVIGDWAAPDFEKAGYQQTATGPVGPADRDLLFRVKQAGLWEMPVGAWMNERAVSPRVREIGAKLNAEHHELDQIVTDAAAQLGVDLPTEPTPEQQGWMADIDAAQGVNVDTTAVFYLRRAHGIILPILAQVRAGTRNAVIRKLAEDGAVFVQRHINYLESTGFVKYEDLPEPPDPTPANQPVQASYFDTHDWRTLLIAGGVIAVLAGFVVLLSQAAFANRSRSKRTRTVRAHSHNPPRRRRRQPYGKHARR